MIIQEFLLILDTHIHTHTHHRERERERERPYARTPSHMLELIIKPYVCSFSSFIFHLLFFFLMQLYMLIYFTSLPNVNLTLTIFLLSYPLRQNQRKGNLSHFDSSLLITRLRDFFFPFLVTYVGNKYECICMYLFISMCIYIGDIFLAIFLKTFSLTFLSFPFLSHFTDSFTFRCFDSVTYILIRFVFLLLSTFSKYGERIIQRNRNSVISIDWHVFEHRFYSSFFSNRWTRWSSSLLFASVRNEGTCSFFLYPYPEYQWIEMKKTCIDTLLRIFPDQSTLRDILVPYFCFSQSPSILRAETPTLPGYCFSYRWCWLIRLMDYHLWWSREWREKGKVSIERRLWCCESTPW